MDATGVCVICVLGTVALGAVAGCLYAIWCLARLAARATDAGVQRHLATQLSRLSLDRPVVIVERRTDGGVDRLEGVERAARPSPIVNVVGEPTRTVTLQPPPDGPYDPQADDEDWETAMERKP